MKKLLGIVFLGLLWSNIGFTKSIIEFDKKYNCKAKDGEEIQLEFSEVKLNKKLLIPIGDLYVVKEYSKGLGLDLSVMHYAINYTNKIIYYFIVSKQSDLFVVTSLMNRGNGIEMTQLTASMQNNAYNKLAKFEGRYGYDLKDYELISNIPDDKITSEILDLGFLVDFLKESLENGLINESFQYGNSFVCKN